MMKKIKAFSFLVVGVLFSTLAFTQSTSISGTILDSQSQESLIGASAVMLARDSTFKIGTITNSAGQFIITGIEPGDYILKVSYIGYLNYFKTIKIQNLPINIGTVSLAVDSKNLAEVTIKDKIIAARLRGDTIEFNSAAYKVNADANAEDLVTKMPGINLQDGKVQAQGEDVKKVLVDGKEFFGGDASIALKNLPAEVVDKIQVFDQQSEQSRFTGFNDGNTEKTINITTKENKSNGTFGKVYAGYGTNNRYNIGGNVNIFKGVQRISILGMSNNINQQNFSSQDLLGISSSSGNSQRGPFGAPGAGGPPPGGGFTGGGPPPGGQMGPNSSTSNFVSGQNGGINTNTSLGLNYIDEWSKKVKVTGSYFFNNSKNTTSSQTLRNYFLSDSTTQNYNENSSVNSNNINHRVNFKLDYNIDSSNSISFTPSFSYQKNTSVTELTAASLREGVGLNNSTNYYSTNLEGHNIANTMLYRHRFKKEGRTISIDLTGSYNNKVGNGGLQSASYYNANDSTSKIDQNTLTKSSGYTVSSNIVYTEPLSKSWQMMLNVSPSYTSSISNKSTSALDTTSNTYSRLDSTLSNTFTYGIWKSSSGAGLRFHKGKVNILLSADYQFVTLLGKQTFPTQKNSVSTFHNIMPKFDILYDITKRSRLHFNYNTLTQTPSVTQLQDVLDNSNPLSVSRGNAQLGQQYMHNFISGLRIMDSSLTRMFFFTVGGSISDNYISNSTITASTDTVLADGTSLARGSQYTRPVNLEGFRSFRTFAVYGLPITPLKTNVNVTGGYSYTRLPGLVNNVLNYSNTSKINAGITLASNISTKYDFTMSYMGNYSFVKNTIQSASDQNYFTGVASAKVNITPISFLNISSDVSYTHYIGLQDLSNPSILLWNAGIGYKFLKSKSAEVRLSVYDILNKNNSITRNITNTYVEDVQTQVLKRYFMLTFTYTIRNFKG